MGDNILFPGAPEYLAYVTAKPSGEKTDEGSAAPPGQEGARLSEEVVRVADIESELWAACV